MIEKTLSQISSAQISDLTDLPFPLLKPSETEMGIDGWLSAFAMYLSGETTWDTVIKQKSKSGDLREAFLLSIEAQKYGFECSRDTLAMLDQNWQIIKRPVKTLMRIWIL